MSAHPCTIPQFIISPTHVSECAVYIDTQSYQNCHICMAVTGIPIYHDNEIKNDKKIKNSKGK